MATIASRIARLPTVRENASSSFETSLKARFELTERNTYEAENHIEVSLREAFDSLEPKLRPPFSLAIPTHEQYLNLNKAILYGILHEPGFAKVHMKHLHGIITDGYEYFTSLLVKLVNELYLKLAVSVKRQLLWVTHEMINVLAVGFDGLLVLLFRQTVGGDFGEENLWLCYELMSLLSANWDCLLEEEPLVMTSALYVLLRLLADHCRVLKADQRVESLRKSEVSFCVRMLKENFALCSRIGRDLIRLLQDLIHVPEFRAIWKDLLYDNLSQIYGLKTPTEYFLLRISPEMESQLRFLYTQVKFGNQRRYQNWFNNKFLAIPDRNTVVIDIVRFLCSSNEVIKSGFVPKWALIGWLLKSGLKNYLEANVKLALFYDWLFFDEKGDNVTSIEPGASLMVYSIPEYIEITQSLLEFLFILLDNYDLERKELMHKGISSAFHALVGKGVVESLEILTSSDRLSPMLKERLAMLLIDPPQLSSCMELLNSSMIE